MKKQGMLTVRRQVRVVALLMAVAVFAPARASSRTPDLMTVERIVVVMRHGVRPPTKDPALPLEIAPDAWPSWSVPPGWLTSHGAEAIRLLGQDDRIVFANQHLLSAAGCPDDGAVAVQSDSDERTIATGDAYLNGLAPGCNIPNHHLTQGLPDPLFHDPAAAKVDPAEAGRAIAATLGPDGLAGAERRQRQALQTLDHILCGDHIDRCGVSSLPSAIAPAAAGKRPKLSGALEHGSSAAQSILLEYADGKPMSEVGWGRASAKDIERIGTLHSEGFALHARPRVLAAANAAGLVQAILAALRSGPARLTVIVGHDTNVANLAGLLDLHWHVPGFAADDPAPGGALVFERVRDSQGHQFVRILYRSQTLEQIRHLQAGGSERQVLPIAKCGPQTMCPLDRFYTLLSP